MNYYLTKYIGEEYGKGKWNVIQVIGNEARYFVLKGDITGKIEPLPFISHGWIEDDEWFTDGEDYTNLNYWGRFEGVLIPF